MSDLNSAIQILNIIVWPIALIIITLLFKKQLRDLINRIKRISVKNLDIQSPHQDENFGVRDELLKKEISSGKENENGRLIFDQLIDLFSDDTIMKVRKSIVEITHIDLTLLKNEKQNEVLLRYTMALYIILSFQQIYGYIFGSQLALLQKINSSSLETKASLKHYYDEAKQIYEKFYQKYSYEEYMMFLVQYGLIIVDGEKVFISKYGRDFLKYLTEAGISLEKNF